MARQSPSGVYTASWYPRQWSHTTKQAPSGDQARSSASDVAAASCTAGVQSWQLYSVTKSLHSLRCRAGRGTASQDYACEKRGESGHKSVLEQPTRCGSAGWSLPCTSGGLMTCSQPTRRLEAYKESLHCSPGPNLTSRGRVPFYNRLPLGSEHAWPARREERVSLAAEVCRALCTSQVTPASRGPSANNLEPFVDRAVSLELTSSTAIRLWSGLKAIPRWACLGPVT